MNRDIVKYPTSPSKDVTPAVQSTSRGARGSDLYKAVSSLKCLETGSSAVDFGIREGINKWSTTRRQIADFCLSYTV
jgi:hypothetical protein